MNHPGKRVIRQLETANHTSEKGLVSRICKELPELSNKLHIIQIENRLKHKWTFHQRECPETHEKM